MSNTTDISKQSTLHTTRLTLIPLSERHLDNFIQLNSEPAVMAHVENGRPLTADESTADHKRRLAVSQDGSGLGYWVGHQSGDFVGWWSLAPTANSEHGTSCCAELGYRLLPKYWRRGLAKEGVRELLRHGFDNLGLDQVYAQTMAVNTASRATMESCGLTYCRTFYVAFDDPIPGTEQGEVEYAITRHDWIRFNNTSTS